MSPDGHSIWVSGHGALQVFLYKHINLQSKALHFLHNQSLGQFFLCAAVLSMHGDKYIYINTCIYIEVQGENHINR